MKSKCTGIKFCKQLVEMVDDPTEKGRRLFFGTSMKQDGSFEKMVLCYQKGKEIFKVSYCPWCGGKLNE